MRRARHVAAIWPAASDSIHSLYRVPSPRLSVIPNARDAEYFQPPNPEQRSAARSQFGVGENDRCIALVGALAGEKQLDIALRAIAAVPGAVVLVAGAGPTRAALEQLAAEILPGRVRFLGTVTDVRPIFHAADAIVLTSRTEGLPGSLIEAGLCQVPAVAVDVVANRQQLGVEARIVCAQKFDTTATLDQWERLLTVELAR